MAAFLGFTVFGADLGIKTIRVDSVEPPDFFKTTGKDIDPEGRHGPDHHRLGQVQQDRRRLRHERLLGVRAGLPVQQAVGDPATSWTACKAKGNPNFGVLYDTCHAHMCRRHRRQPARAARRSLPGGALELLEKLKGKITHVHLIDSRRLAERAQHQHAQPVRHRHARLRQAAAGAEPGGRAQRLVGASICASGRTPGT